ncbi:hypothetical protein [Halostella sp. PRR32]|uniref:hypothetical protein n=1 Tax=Halostella sp. PRR32 TaxID=3098147 RepID=UPI002B1E28C6|nr:hypothetical protein [Halostella sp. PRR32]
MDEDWDNLIILDGCRYDTFARHNTLEGDLIRVISGGSSTPEFIHHNYVDRTFPDTVYVSANPHIIRQEVSENFFHDVQLWREDWNDDLKTVRPEAVVESALDIVRKYPNKRLIIHFMQPHYPFIGPEGKQIEQQGLLGDDTKTLRIWDQLRHGQIDTATVRRAYEENLEVTMPHVERLVESLSGKSVVTGDHGNSFGRFGVYGHPHRLYLEDLVAVPWLTLSGGKRREITAGDIEQRENERPDDQVSDRLSHLGYLQE